MRQRRVEFSEDATRDLLALYDWIAEVADPEVAMRYLDRLEDYCHNFDLASERGQLRGDIRPGLRVVGFERRVAIAFLVEDERVVVLRLFYGGQDWEGSL